MLKIFCFIYNSFCIILRPLEFECWKYESYLYVYQRAVFFCPAACIINIFNAYYQMLIVHFTISSSHFFQRNVSNCGLHGLCFLLLKIVMLTVRFCLLKWYMITIQYRQLLFVLKLKFLKFTWSNMQKSFNIYNK